MAGYTKLSSSLVTSTVWRESATTRCVWITMLSLADQHGEVRGSIPGLADMARVTIPECEAALEKFLAPDPYSRTQDCEGRRIAKIDDGWFLINYAKHRDFLSLDHRRTMGRERARRFRERQKAGQDSNADVTLVTEPDDKQMQYAEANGKAGKLLTAGFIKNPNGNGFIKIADELPQGTPSTERR